MIINELPETWLLGKLGDLCFTTSGGTPSRKRDDFYGGNIPWVKSGELSKGLITKTEEYITGEAVRNSSAKIFPAGTLLIALYGATIGKLGFLGVDAATNQAVCGIFKNDILDLNYLYYFLYHNKNKLIEQGAGGAQPNISQTILKDLDVTVPPLAEQLCIVSKIEELFTELEKGIETLKTAQQQLKVYRQAVLKYAFEGNFTSKWRDDNPKYSAIKELELVSSNRLKLKSVKSIYNKKISHDFKYTKHDQIHTWAKGALDKLVYIAARIGWRGLKKDEYTLKGPLFLSVHSLNHGKYVDFSEAFHISQERYDESPEIKLEDGDVLLCKDGAGIGKIGIIKNLPEEGTVNSSLLLIRGMEVLNQEFLFYLFSGPVLQKIVFERITGSATPHLFQNDISKFELLIPPYKEQLEIVQEIESRLSVCDKIEESIEQGLQQAEALRQSILKKAFEGKLVPQDPNDEPANVLLERIKAERAIAQPEKKTRTKKVKV